MRTILLISGLLLAFAASAQRQVKGVILDSLSQQPLPFATIRVGDQQKMKITETRGVYDITLPAGIEHITVSYVGHYSKTILLSTLKDWDTIFLAPSSSDLGAIIIRSQTDKIKRIVNAAVRKKDDHNPELYEQYICNIYYKMTVDILPFGDPSEGASKKREREEKQKRKMTKRDSSLVQEAKAYLGNHKHIMFSETYSRRWYKKPQQLQETILASRFSGLKKTYFTNVVTDVLPFHIYGDFINLNGRNYINPIAKGWQSRYRFFLQDEIPVEGDTVYILSFEPKKGVSFNFLTGLVYIHSKAHAISHFTATTDNSVDRSFHIEHIYKEVDGKWFPRELNYDLTYRKTPTPNSKFIWNGHSVIDSISFDPNLHLDFDKAQTVKIHDSVDLRSAEEWRTFRRDSITGKEANTYAFMDSLSERHHLEKLVTASAKLSIGRWPMGIFDLDMNRLLARNSFEGFRLGAGLYTNDNLSKYYSIGGWAGYGTRDQVWKYGASATLFFKGSKDNYLDLTYEKNYRNPGQVQLHSDLEAAGLRYWMLGLVDKFEGYRLRLNVRKNYWQFRPEIGSQLIKPFYVNSFQVSGKQVNSFVNHEAGIGFRYAYGEKRIPVFGYYVPSSTKYPVLYLKLSGGKVVSGDYKNDYVRVLAGATWIHRTNRWGKDAFRLEGGYIQSLNNEPLPRSFLLAGNGLKMSGLNYYSSRGFTTMQPFDFYSDRYVAFHYKHDFDKYLWDLKLSKPYISLAHNMAYGSLSSESRKANSGIRSFDNGYHESGILLNQILRKDIRFGDFSLAGGYFYPWKDQTHALNKGTWVFAMGVRF